MATLDERMKQAIQIAESICGIAIDPSQLNLQNIAIAGAYYHGAMMALNKVKDEYLPKITAKEKPYVNADFKLFLSNQYSTQLWFNGYNIRYRNHQHNKKGKVTECEAYFVERKTVEQEVKQFIFSF